MHPIKKLAGETFLYGLSSIIGRLINYLLVPLYTSVLLPAEYGVITEFYAYTAFFNILYTYGMETAYFRFAAQGQEDPTFCVTMSALCLTSPICSGILALFATPLINWLGHPGYERYVYYLAIILATDAMLVIPFAQLRLQKRPFYFVRVKLIQISVNVLLNLIWLYGLAQIYQGRWLIALQTLAQRVYIPARHIDYVFFANLTASVVTLWIFRKLFYKLKFQLSWQQIKPLLTYAFPLLLMSLNNITNEMFSRILLKHLLPVDFYPGKSNETILGIFGACYKLSMLMLLGIQAFRYAAEPFFFTQAQDKRSPILFSQVMHGFILVACFILLAITANLDLLAYLLLRNPIYRTGIEIVPYLLLAYLWSGVYYNLSIWFKIIDKNYYGALITSIGLLITVVFNICLVPHIGYWGSVWASVMSYTTMSSLSYYWGQKYWPIPYRLGLALTYVLGTLGLVPILRSLIYRNLANAVMINLGLMLFFGVLLWRWKCSIGDLSRYA